MTTGILRHSTVNPPGVLGVTVVGTVSGVQSLSSSGQSSKPSHQDVALMQMLLVGQSTVPGGQGLQMQPHEGVSTLCKPCKKKEIGLIFYFFFQFGLEVYQQERSN
jgi:hypothetical protein